MTARHIAPRHALIAKGASPQLTDAVRSVRHFVVSHVIGLVGLMVLAAAAVGTVLTGN